MKKIIAKSIIAAVFTCIGFNAMAQNSDKKTAVAESEKSTAQDKPVTTPGATQIVPVQNALPVNGEQKPIIPGGEFKPVDTRGPVKNYTKTTDPQTEKKAAPAPQALQQ